jgi:hypothetical protein
MLRSIFTGRPREFPDAPGAAFVRFALISG